PYGRRFHIALDPRDLSGEAKPRIGFQPQALIEQHRAVQKSVAVQTAEPRELCLLEPRDGAEDADLLGVFQLGLEPDHVPQAAERIVLPELHYGVGPLGTMRVGEADRL